MDDYFDFWIFEDGGNWGDGESGWFGDGSGYGPYKGNEDEDDDNWLNVAEWEDMEESIRISING
jgi:hypothetical protein